MLKNIVSLILVAFFIACVPLRGKILLKLKLYLTTSLKLHKLHYTKLTEFNLIFAPHNCCWPNQYNAAMNVKLSIKVSLNTAITVTTNPCQHSIRYFWPRQSLKSPFFVIQFKITHCESTFYLMFNIQFCRDVSGIPFPVSLIVLMVQ